MSEIKKNTPEYHQMISALRQMSDEEISTLRQPKIYGYARVSSQGQARDGNSLEIQEQALREAGATEIYSDVFTGTAKSRPELDRLLTELQVGDTLVVCKLDRIARSVRAGCELIQTLVERGVNVNVLNMGVLDNSPTGKLILHIMLSFAEFEKDMIMQRTQEGKAATGHYGGRPRKFSPERLEHAMELLDKGYSYNEVARITEVSRSTLLRERNARK